MQKKIDLKNAPIPSLFFSYFIPSLFTMLALSTYSAIDGIFVGKKVGSDALAAIGISWPVFLVIISFELLLSFGGGTLASFYLGKSKPLKARIVFSSIFYFIVIVSLVLGLICFYFVENITSFLGASERLEGYVIEYLSVIFLGMVFIVLHPLSDIFTTNDKRPMLATISMIVGAVSNIILNYFFIFVFEWGVMGSALATVAAHIIGSIILIWHFLFKKGDLFFVRSFSIKSVMKAAKIGIPQSFAELSAAIVIFLFNITLMSVVGEKGVTIYSILMYCGIIFFTILLSVTQGMQPIVSFSYGATLLDRTEQILRYSLKAMLSMGVLLYVFAYFFGDHLIFLFLKQEQLQDKVFISEIVLAMRIYYAGYIFLGFNMLIATYLQSLQRTLSSFIITFLYTIGFIMIFLPIFSHLFGEIGIWSSYPCAQSVALVFVTCILLYERRRIFGTLKK
ncbi:MULTISPECIES: MATE family efflux transporter [unclassified Helicobacter]|uniref:MATE family efflux transporter n=1 Tax=unclassified Helicobacter TaxID=2593540 RepID=UPI0013158C1F|nr:MULTISPECIES: MATE family efflux transporter [unclassified Helicobacter]